jgi:hypothetical protein
MDKITQHVTNRFQGLRAPKLQRHIQQTYPKWNHGQGFGIRVEVRLPPFHEEANLPSTMGHAIPLPNDPQRNQTQKNEAFCSEESGRLVQTSNDELIRFFNP